MQIVIDIPEDEYNIAKYGQYGNINIDIVRKALANGTPLPKGHGRLIDENKLLENLKESANHHANNSREESLLYRDRVIVMEQPTIIDADKESEEKE